MKDILKCNEMYKVVEVNSVEEIPTLVFNEKNCFNSFTVVIDRDVYDIIVFENREEMMYKGGRFLLTTNEYKRYTGRIPVIQDKELKENILMTFPRYYHIKEEFLSI